jgi:hypothetical protein
MNPPRPRPDFLDAWVNLWLSSAVTMAHLATAPFDAFRDSWDADEEMGAAHEPVPDDELPPVSTVSAVRPADVHASLEVTRLASETCANCRHFCRSNAQAGECRRNAPFNLTGGHHAEWPLVTDGEWCGDFMQVHIPGGLTKEELRGLN